MSSLPPIVSLSPLRSALLPWRGAQGPMLTVVCKATYTLSPNESPLAPQQEYPIEEDDHWDDDRAKSVRAPTEMVPTKPRAELFVVGSSFAPGGRPERSVVARVVVGEIDKSILVAGDRHVRADGTVTEPLPFTRMPLRYERAAGGPESSNPVGVRDLVDGLGKRPLPNLLPVDFNVMAVPETIATVGLGPIAPSWPMRAARLGARGSAWADAGSFDEPWPDDLDPSFFVAAPWDQTLETLRANERIVLENLHPTHRRLVTSLPGVEPRVFVETDGGSPHELSMRCDALWIDTDRGICTLTWRGQLPRDRPIPRRLIVASATLGRRLAWGDVAPLLRTEHAIAGGPLVDSIDTVEAEPDDEDRDPYNGTAPLQFRANSPVLPFVEAKGAAQPRAAAPKPERVVPALSAPPGLMASPWTAPPAPAVTSTLGWERAPDPQIALAKNEGPIAIPTSSDRPLPNLKGSGSSAALASDAAAHVAVEALRSRPPAATEASVERTTARRKVFVDLLWFDPEAPKLLKSSAAFKDLLAPASGERSWRKLDASTDAGAGAGPDVEGKRDVLRVLTGSTPLDGEPLRKAVNAAFAGDPVTFAHPLVVVAGELAPSFDEVETLKSVAQLGALAGGDKRARDAVAVATEALRGGERELTRDTAAALVRATLDAFGHGAGALEAAVTRALLDRRSYRKKRLFGSARLRAELSIEGAAPLPVYLSEAIEAVLPALPKVRVRVLAEVRPQEDYAETVGECLLAYAVGRIVRG